MKQVSRTSGISSGFRALFIFSAILALTSLALASSGQLTSNPSAVNLGNVQLGSSQTQSINLTNAGSSRLIITQATSSVPAFTLTGLSYPVTLYGGQSVSCNITFKPQSAVASSGSIAITFHNHRNTATYSMSEPVSGTGVAIGTLGSSRASLSFGSVTVGSNQSLSETVTNTGGSSVTISQVAINGTGFSFSGIAAPVILTSGQSASFNVTFTPTSAGSASGNVTITSNGSNPTLTIPLSGTGVATAALGANPSSLSFGSVTVGSNLVLAEKVTNSGGSSVSISQVGISGTGFSFSGITAPVTLTSGQSASFNVTFTPTSAGSVSGNVTITSNGSNPTLTIPLSGAGVASTGQLTVAPTTLPLGSVVVGNSAPASGSLTASTASVTVTAATSNNSVFSVGGLSLPVTIPAGQSVPFTVTFSPTTAGAATGVLTFTSNAQPSTTPETLTGTGTAAPTHSVNLSWSASTSSGISGYNVYRAVYVSSCGSFSKINSVLNTGTLYTDTAVADGTWYCYVTTAVNSSKEESGYSNIVTKVEIPAP